MKEVERICRESNCYDPERVKNFLKVSTSVLQSDYLFGLIIFIANILNIIVLLFRKPN